MSNKIVVVKKRAVAKKKKQLAENFLAFSDMMSRLDNLREDLRLNRVTGTLQDHSEAVGRLMLLNRAAANTLAMMFETTGKLTNQPGGVKKLIKALERTPIAKRQL